MARAEPGGGLAPVFLPGGADRAPVVEVEKVVAWRDGERHPGADTLAVEEPLEIRLAGWSVTVTMRTPGDDLDLAAGFLYTEGIIHDRSQIASLARCPTDDPQSAANIVNVNPSEPALVDPARWQRNFASTSSCGICGTARIEDIRREVGPIEDSTRITVGVLYRMAGELRAAQRLFDTTGGLHAAALFDASGHLIVLREDVGRHNAVDKAIGHALRAGLTPLHGHILLVSSRASFEIAQKALVARIPIVAAVSAASSLAVECARDSGMTLIGFLRGSGEGGRFNVYAHGERIVQ